MTTASSQNWPSNDLVERNGLMKVAAEDFLLEKFARRDVEGLDGPEKLEKVWTFDDTGKILRRIWNGTTYHAHWYTTTTTRKLT